MNLTSNGKFHAGNVAAKINIGKKHHSTIVKELLSEKIKNLDGKLFEITLQLLNSENLKVKAFAWKELLKYRLSSKHEVLQTIDERELSEAITKRLGL